MKRIICIVSFFAGISAVAQQARSMGNLLSNNQQLIESAVKDGVFVIHRCYQLQDTTSETPAFYGWNNLSYFGETYSLGIKAKEGYYLDNKAFRPWIYDSKFEQYLQSRQFVPILSESRYRTTEDTSYQTLPYRNVQVKEIAANQLYLAQDSLFNQKGFSINCSDGLKKGWLVWLVSNKPLTEQNNQALEFVIYRSELTFVSGKECYEIRDEPATAKPVLGGLYIVPEFTEIGQVVFYLSGSLHYENNKWQVVRIKNADNINATQSHAAESGLTPVNMEQNKNGQAKNKKKSNEKSNEK